MTKYDLCRSTKIYTDDDGELQVAKCTGRKRHEEDHTDGERTWADADHQR